MTRRRRVDPTLVVDFWGNDPDPEQTAKRLGLTLAGLRIRGALAGLPNLTDADGLARWNAAGRPVPWTTRRGDVSAAEGVPQVGDIWTEAEIRILSENAHLTASRIVPLLDGRSERAVRKMRLRLKQQGRITYVTPVRVIIPKEGGPKRKRSKASKQPKQPKQAKRRAAEEQASESPTMAMLRRPSAEGPLPPFNPRETLVRNYFGVARDRLRCEHLYGDKPYWRCTAEFEMGKGPWCAEHRSHVYVRPFAAQAEGKAAA